MGVESGMRRSGAVGDDLDVDVAAGRMAIGADLFVRLFRQGLKLGRAAGSCR